ncbi:MAG: aminotransferase class III-fold pyridoxal phosphate-dependent enzyme [Armatimonadetes bacterium]|nr:aminotransferase class III-fold pyridoxal phosphate-dependent enzyme [Armatimonadota bacterium]
MVTTRSEALYAQARAVLPGGVCSSTRLNQALGRPFFAARGKGARVYDVDGREYIDLCCGHGAALLGHAHPAITQALAQAADLGHLCAFETEYHSALAARLGELIPCAERVRFTNSGTEATMHALRACRGYTGRDKIIRVEGHFHGYHDAIYIGGQPPAAHLPGNRAQPFVESAGIPTELARFIVPIPFNDLEAAEAAIERHGAESCCLILEPVNFNSGGLLPEPGYLQGLRELCDASGVLLFFDEIQTSFKASPGGAQQDFGVVPDLCTIGKALGGGLPLSAICGRAELMDIFKPIGPVQHSGTFNAPLHSVLAGLAFLDELTRPGFYEHLQKVGDQLLSGLATLASKQGWDMVTPRHGARFGLVLGCPPPLRRYEDVLAHDSQRLLAFFREAHARGVYFHDYGGGPCHHGWSIAHQLADIDSALERLDAAMAAVGGA